MGNIRWDPEKSKKLKEERGISFEEILVCVESQQVITIIENPSKKYHGQMVLVIRFKNYVYYVPFVKQEEDMFLKTIIPGRKLTKRYRK